VALPRLTSLGTYLRAGSIRKGLIGGSSGWMLIGALVWVPRLLRRVLGRRPEVIATERVEAGQGLVIHSYRPASRRDRRAAVRR